jgi:alcohol-forming fatty acyl-CoA reductase
LPDRLEKLKFICGDVCHDNLGLSSSDRNILINEVDLIFHCAASVSFEWSLLDILKVNVEGTNRLLLLATEMKRLEVFTFVSTAFSQSYQTTLEEKHYSTGLDLPTLLNAIKTNDSECINALQKKQVQLTTNSSDKIR